jgi:hypothetical protein
MDFTGYRKIASTCPMSTGTLKGVPIWRGEALIDYIAGVARSCRFEKDDSGFFIRARPVF